MTVIRIRKPGDTVHLPSRFGALANIPGTYVYSPAAGHGVSLGRVGIVYVDSPDELVDPNPRREKILRVFADIMTNVLYYDRKEDDNLPVGAIEEAIAADEVTIDELMAIIRAGLEGKPTPS